MPSERTWRPADLPVEGLAYLHRTKLTHVTPSVMITR
jgi:hypothetical protein